MLTPPGPTNSPTMISTIPATTAPRTRLTIPAITRTAAMIHNSVSAPPLLPACIRTASICCSLPCWLVRLGTSSPALADARQDVPGDERQDGEHDDHDRRVLDRGVADESAALGRGVVAVVLLVAHLLLLSAVSRIDRRIPEARCG